MRKKISLLTLGTTLGLDGLTGATWPATNGNERNKCCVTNPVGLQMLASPGLQISSTIAGSSRIITCIFIVSLRLPLCIFIRFVQRRLLRNPWKRSKARNVSLISPEASVAKFTLMFRC